MVQVVGPPLKIPLELHSLLALVLVVGENT